MPIFESVNVTISAAMTLSSNLVASLSKKRGEASDAQHHDVVICKHPGTINCWKIWVLETKVLSYLGISGLGINDRLHVVCEYRSLVDPILGTLLPPRLWMGVDWKESMLDV